MKRRIGLRRLPKHSRRRLFWLVACALFGGALWGEAVAQQKGAGARLSSDARGERRVALVIGNSNYWPEVGRLKNPANDASDVAAALQGLGFKIIGDKAQLDVSLRQMGELVRAFGREIRRGGVGVFYYSGHGIQVNRLNYLLPLGARIEKEQDVPFEAFDVDRVLGEMEAAENKLNILILDACRNNPLTRSFRSGGKGLMRPESIPVGTYVAFAARDGQVASDNAAGRNGLYTQELLRNLRRPGLRLEDIFINTRREVRRLSQNTQIPVEYGSIDAPFFFLEAEGATTPALGSSSPAPNTFSVSATDYHERAAKHSDEGNYDLAIADYTKAIQLDPKFAAAYNNRGNAYKNVRDYESALADYTRAIQLGPKLAAPYNNRGIVYDNKKEHDLAIADYTKAIEIEPNLAVAYYNRGNAYYDKGDYDRAIADYTKAIEVEPKFAATYNNRGNAYYDKGDYDRSIVDYVRAIELAPNDASTYCNRGNVYYDKGDYDHAIADYTRAIELDPKHLRAYKSRANAYDKKGDSARATADRRKAAELEK